MKKTSKDGPPTKPAKKPGPGRGSTKPRFDAIKQAAFLREMRDNKRGRGMAARAIGVDPSTVRRHVAADEKFAAAVSQAEMESEGEKIEEVEDALYQAAIGGNVTAIQVFLYNRASDRWADKRNLNLHLPPDEAARKLAAILNLAPTDLPT